jgi:hypothetical protein
LSKTGVHLRVGFHSDILSISTSNRPSRNFDALNRGGIRVRRRPTFLRIDFIITGEA